jgi:hypothetical protein
MAKISFGSLSGRQIVRAMQTAHAPLLPSMGECNAVHFARRKASELLIKCRAVSNRGVPGRVQVGER